jgi:hypothetical protein
MKNSIATYNNPIHPIRIKWGILGIGIFTVEHRSTTIADLH